MQKNTSALDVAGDCTTHMEKYTPADAFVPTLALYIPLSLPS